MTEAERQYIVNEVLEQLNKTMVDINKLPTGNTKFGGTLLIAQNKQLVKGEVNSLESLYDIDFEESVDGSGIITVSLKNATNTVVKTKSFKIHTDRINAIERDLYLGNMISGLNYAESVSGTISSNSSGNVKLNSVFIPKMDTGIYIDIPIVFSESAFKDESVIIKLINDNQYSTIKYTVPLDNIQSVSIKGQIPQFALENNSPYELQIINNTSSEITYNNPVVRYYRLSVLDIVDSGISEIRQLKKDINDIKGIGNVYTKQETDDLLNTKLNISSTISEQEIKDLIKL